MSCRKRALMYIVPCIKLKRRVVHKFYTKHFNFHTHTLKCKLLVLTSKNYDIV